MGDQAILSISQKKIQWTVDNTDFTVNRPLSIVNYLIVEIRRIALSLVFPLRLAGGVFYF
jgi:hypothetical protein